MKLMSTRIGKEEVGRERRRRRSKLAYIELEVFKSVCLVIVIHRSVYMGEERVQDFRIIYLFMIALLEFNNSGQLQSSTLSNSKHAAVPVGNGS